jgi:hypothetical protein
MSTTTILTKARPYSRKLRTYFVISLDIASALLFRGFEEDQTQTGRRPKKLTRF